MSETLSKGWVQCSIGDVVGIQNGYAFKSKDFTTEGVPLVKQTNLIGDTVNLSKCQYLDKRFLKDKSNFIINKDEILIGMSGSLGKVAIYKYESPALQNQRTGKLVFYSDSLLSQSLFLHYFTNISYILEKSGKGCGVQNISATEIENLEFPFPPLNEQKRIVAKLDAIIPRIDSLKARMDKIPALIKRFRQSVLTAAVTGKLTEKWREAHLEVESSDLLLEKIENERKSLKRKHKTGYSFKTDSHIDERYISITLPKSWEKTNIDLVSLYIVDCPHSTPKWADSGHICLRTTNFLSNKLNLSEVRYVSKDTYKKRIERLKPEKGDVLYSREGGILGIACILDSDEDVCLGQRMMMFRTSKNIITEYFSFYLNSPIILQHVKNLIGGSAAPHINIRDIKKYPFPLPPLEEQKEIVRQVDNLFALSDKLEFHYQNAKARIDKLSQSVLAKAFRGELVPQDPNDEPAEKLLERIMAEKAKMEEALKGAKKKGGGQKANAGSRK